MKIVCLVAVSVLFGAAFVSADEMVLTTYYPAPNGQYLDMNVSGTLTANILNVTGILTVQNLIVNQTSTLTGNVGIGKAPSLTHKMDVLGSVNLSSTLGVMGNVGIGAVPSAYRLEVTGTANVTGATTLRSTLGVTGAAILSGTLSVAGTSALVGNVSAGGTLTANGNISTNGTLRSAGNIETGGNSHVNAQDYFIRANSRWASQLATETNLNNNVTNLQNQINALSAAISALQAQVAAGHTLTTSGVYDRVGTCDYGDIAVGTRYVMGTCGTYTCWFTVYTQCADVSVN
jgi:hypothetical protein